MIPLMIVLVSGVIFGGCAAPAPAPAPAEEAPTPTWPAAITVGHGPVGGSTSIMTMAVAKYWEKELDIPVTCSPGVAKSNLRRFEAGRLDIMNSPTSWAYAARNGMEEYGFAQPIRDLRVMMHIYPNNFYFIALKASGLKTIADLKGKRVGCGPSAASWDRMVGDKLEASGIKYFGDAPDIQRTFASWQDMCTMVGDGVLDACVVMAGGLAPEPASLKLMQDKELVALEWDPKVIKKFEGTVFPPGVVSGKILPFREDDHICFSGGCPTYVARDTVDEELVYTLTKVAYENLDKLANETPYWQYPQKYPEFLAKDFGLPFHPGAVRYWKEVGLWQ